MRATFYNWAVLAAVFLGVAACQTTNRPRVVRLALNPDNSTWRLGVNGCNEGDALSEPVLTDQLTSLRLHQGDIILVNSPPVGKPNLVRSTEGWISRYCQSNNVAVYLTHVLPEIDMYSVRAYHWSAPYDNPFDLAKASFFCEGKPVGRGRDGFEAMLRQIADERPRQIFILGSMYDFNRSFPPDPNPYEGLRDRLGEALKGAGTDFIQLDALPGF